jgi:hypothetical protein
MIIIPPRYFVRRRRVHAPPFCAPGVPRLTFEVFAFRLPADLGRRPTNHKPRVGALGAAELRQDNERLVCCSRARVRHRDDDPIPTSPIYLTDPITRVDYCSPIGLLFFASMLHTSSSSHSATNRRDSTRGVEDKQVSALGSKCTRTATRPAPSPAPASHLKPRTTRHTHT